MIELQQSANLVEEVKESAELIVEEEVVEIGEIEMQESSNLTEEISEGEELEVSLQSDASIVVPKGTKNINQNGTHNVYDYAFANVQVQADVIDVLENGVSVVGADKIARTTKPTKTSELENDSGFLTEHQSLSNYYTKSETNSQISSHHDSTKYDASNPSGFITSSAITGKENTSNKVTSLSASSTNTQYPSAKCVYDIVGNIEATLRAIRGV